MSILRRNLAVHFQKSVRVTSTEVITQSVDVSVIPLSDASNADLVATYVGGIQSATVELLNDDNVVVFSLVPSVFPGLSNPINYRIMWRVGGVTGRTETYDFAMPDADVSFDELQAIGNIIDGEAYLQQSDLGVAGRVARLNELGQVVDSAGDPVAMPIDIAGVQNQLTAAVLNLQQESQSQRNFLLQNLEYELAQANSSLNTSLQQAVTGFNIGINNEQATRFNAIQGLTTTVNSLSTSLTSTTASFTTSITQINDALDLKADLDGGKIPLSQIPSAAITHWIPLDSSNDRFDLTYPDEVQLGDIVLTPTGLFGLTGTNPALEASWYRLNQIQSVNGKTGAVVLNAADVGAIAANAAIPQSQIAGLSTTIAGLTPTSTATSLQSQVTSIVNDPKIVKLNNSNQIASTLLDANVAYVNVINQIVKKDGTVLSDPASRGVISVNGKNDVVTLTPADVGALAANASIPQSQITGLIAGLAAKADLSNGVILDAQVPSIPQGKITGLTDALAARATLVGGNIPLAQLPITIPQARITDLATLVSGNSLTGTSNAVNRITSLEGRVQNLEVNGGGGGGESVSVTTAVTWSGLSENDVVENFSSVVLASPFGIYSSGPDVGKWYYNKAGVPSGDAAYPFVTPNGRLRLYKRNESGPPEPEYALASQLVTLGQSITTLEGSLAGKADTSALNLLSGTVSGLNTSKASIDPITNDLVLSQLPFVATPNPKVRSSLVQMQALTTSEVHVGDVCIVTGVGTYTLMGNNPASINNLDGWALHATTGGSSATGTVKSISGPSLTKIFPDGTGNISLQASDIGAATTGALSSYVPFSTYTPAIDSKLNADEVNTAISTSSAVRGRVDYAVRSFQIGTTTFCATGVPIVSGAPNGAPVIDRDGSNQIPAPNNALVLLTNQSDSRYNGIWRVNTGGAWTRPTDYAANTRVNANTLVLVNNTAALGGLGATGSTNFSVWQNSTAAVVDANTGSATTWRNLGSIAPVSITGNNGITVSGTYPNLTIGSDTAGGFVRKFTLTATPTSANYIVTHNLNTLYPQVTVIDDVSNSAVLVGWKLGLVGSSTSSDLLNKITLEFSTTAWNNSYRISVHG